MDATQAIRALALAKGKLPVEAIVWCREHWDLAAPRLLDVLKHYADGTSRSHLARDALFFILHLFGERGEPRCFESLCRLARDEDAITEVLGDGVTESLAAILAASYDGNPEPLKAVIEDSEAYDFARNEAFNAFGYLTATGRIPLAETERYLGTLHQLLMPQAESWVWYSWAETIALLRLDALMPLVDDAFARDLIPVEIIGDKDSYDELREEARTHSNPASSFERECIRPYDDMISYLSTWAAFRPRGERFADDSDDDDVIESVDQAVAAFASAKRKLPIGAMLWCRDHWQLAAPALIRIVERYADGSDRSDDAANAALFALHIAAEQRESRMMVPLCRMARDVTAIETVLGGDGVTESLGSILIGVYGDDPSPLKTLIEAADADEYVRDSALAALGYLTAAGRIPLAATSNYLTEIYDTLQPQAASHVWYGWAEIATLLRLDGAADRVERLFARGLLEDEYDSEQDFRDLHEKALAGPTLLSNFEGERFGPIDDAIDALSQWACFRDDDDDWGDDEPTDEDLENWARSPEPPAVNPFKNVGRNDPCPCGSGKKFKKCCLGVAPG